MLRESSEEEMIACFLRGELSSERFAPAICEQLATSSRPEELLTEPDLTDPQANDARRNILAVTPCGDTWLRPGP